MKKHKITRVYKEPDPVTQEESFVIYRGTDDNGQLFFRLNRVEATQLKDMLTAAINEHELSRRTYE